MADVPTDAVVPTTSAALNSLLSHLMQFPYVWSVLTGEATDTVPPTRSAAYMQFRFKWMKSSHLRAGWWERRRMQLCRRRAPCTCSCCSS